MDPMDKMETKQIIAHAGQRILVDQEDYSRLAAFRWYVYASGYAIDGKGHYLHRLVVSAPRGMCTDHINGNRIDNRKNNLRVCTPSQNLANSKVRLDNKTGYKGVQESRLGVFEANIHFQGKHVYIGRFNDVETAAEAYKQRALQLFGEYAL